MPPKAKFTKEEIINVAMTIIRKKGTTALTARELGARLGSSARPIFTVFENMEEVHEETLLSARTLYNGYVQKALLEKNAFKGVGVAYIEFAQNEPKLFQLLFMKENTESIRLPEILAVIDENHREILLSIQKSYELDEESAWKIYRHLWIYTHGIATLCATKMCSFSQEEIEQMLAEVCKGVLGNLKNTGVNV